MIRIVHRYQGWLMFCPVIFDRRGDGANIDARWLWLRWLLSIAYAVNVAAVYVLTALRVIDEGGLVIWRIRPLPVMVTRWVS